MVKEIALPSGTVATIRRCAEPDLKQAMLMCPKDEDGEREDFLTFALIALLTTFNGLSLTVEDVGNLPLSDLEALLHEVGDFWEFDLICRETSMGGED